MSNILFHHMMDMALHKAGVIKPRIHTEHVYPPIPVRQFDWSAVTDDYDGADDSRHPIGHGRTEIEAVQDLLEQINDR